MTTRFKVGDRVRLKQDVERYPHFIAPKGLTGTVTYVGPRRHAHVTLTMRPDRHLPGAEEWDNQIEWSYDDDPEADLVLVSREPPKPKKPRTTRERLRVAKKVHVTFEGGSHFPTVQAWSFGEQWNGWEVPYFEYRVAKKVATELTRDGMVTIFDGPTDSFYSYAEGQHVEPTQAEFNRLHDKNLWYQWEPSTIATEEGQKKVWSIGGAAFTWERDIVRN